MQEDVFDDALSQGAIGARVFALDPGKLSLCPHRKRCVTAEVHVMTVPELFASQRIHAPRMHHHEERNVRVLAAGAVKSESRYADLEHDLDTLRSERFVIDLFALGGRA